MDQASDVPAHVAKPLSLRPFGAAMLSPGRVGNPAAARSLARPYRDASHRLSTWIERGWASEEREPALYVHEYTAEGLTVRGLVGALDLSRRTSGLDDRAVWPHEEVHPEQAGDLASRMEKLRLNPAPILLVHGGNRTVRELTSQTTARPPDRSFVDHAAQKHRVWRVDATDVIAQFQRALSGCDALIADGHHRFAAYLAMQNRFPGTAWDHGLVMLVDQSDTPLHLGPIHRSVTGLDLHSIRGAATRLGARTQVLARPDALNTLAPDTFVVSDGESWSSVQPTLSRGQAVVEWLHDELVPTIGESIRIGYHHDVKDALSVATSDTVAILVPGLTFSHVRDLVTSGRLLPEKATSFQPKPSLGVVMRSLADA